MKNRRLLLTVDLDGVFNIMYYLYIATGMALLISFIADKKKSIKAIKIAYKMLVKILPSFLMMLMFISILLYLIPDSVISAYLENDNKFIGLALASFLGSITLMPGFIAFPLCGILLKKGISYMVLSAFSTTLMMVGIITFPIEKAYFGIKVTIIRNIISFLIALIIALVIGFCFGELL
jgi:uncharacterized membrane protein YraQ (UPF0718 family)